MTPRAASAGHRESARSHVRIDNNERQMMFRPRTTVLTMLLACVIVMTLLEGRPRARVAPAPNILFIILDDVGKDQLAAFNTAATTFTPILNAIAAAGAKFTNFYTMPECSPTRAAFFTGRYPHRTGVAAALLELDLPASQVSPFEVTTPRVLSTAGYTSAMIGKYHLGGPENNPYGVRAPLALGWDYFHGGLQAAPASIDVTLGGQYTRDTARYSCGFPAGAARGAAWFEGEDHRARCDDNRGAGYTGQQAVTLGGIPALDAAGDPAPTCREAAGTGPDFTRSNGYYVWPYVSEDATSVRTAQSRRYMTTATTDGAIEWIRARSRGAESRPWMATVSYNAIHTPFQQPPADLYPPGFVWPAGVPESCTDPVAQRVLSGLMLTALDREIGRLLVGAGLADVDSRGQLVYRPEATNRMVVIAGDNGSFTPSVRAPYDPVRAKGSPYESGIRTPLIVSGPLVNAPGRSVEHLVNAVDLFQLFGEIAGIDVRRVVPASHIVDARPVLPYLTNPSQPAERRSTFTQLAPAIKPASVRTWPCVMSIGPIHIASDRLFSAQGLCEDNGGTWFGPTASQPTPQYQDSCAIRAAGVYNTLAIAATRVWTVRNHQFKLVKQERAPCDSSLGEYEFFDLSPSAANPAGLDARNLLTNGQPAGLSADQMANFLELQSALQAQLNSERACPGDGNLDKQVDMQDRLDLYRYWGLPSVFDFTQDGNTDAADLQVVAANFGTSCR
jgi:arylsulfatase A-like enzyme